MNREIEDPEVDTSALADAVRAFRRAVQALVNPLPRGLGHELERAGDPGLLALALPLVDFSPFGPSLATLAGDAAQPQLAAEEPDAYGLDIRPAPDQATHPRRDEATPRSAESLGATSGSPPVFSLRGRSRKGPAKGATESPDRAGESEALKRPPWPGLDGVQGRLRARSVRTAQSGAAELSTERLARAQYGSSPGSSVVGSTLEHPSPAHAVGSPSRGPSGPVQGAHFSTPAPKLPPDTGFVRSRRFSAPPVGPAGPDLLSTLVDEVLHSPLARAQSESVPLAPAPFNESAGPGMPAAKEVPDPMRSSAQTGDGLPFSPQAGMAHAARSSAATDAGWGLLDFDEALVGANADGPLDAQELAALVNDALIEQARRHGLDLS